jgi:hypothetical protein
VMGDQALREDFIDVALIEKAKKVKGRSSSAKEYFARRRRVSSAAKKIVRIYRVAHRKEAYR